MNKTRLKMSGIALAAVLMIGNVMTVCANEPDPCTHSNMTYTSNSDGTHDGDCDDCDYTVTGEACGDWELHATGDICGYCGYSRPHECSYSSAWSHDETHHWHACLADDCIGTSDRAQHTYDENNTCTVCGYHMHTYGNAWAYNETQHWQVCSTCGEGALTATAADHNFLNNVCTTCGYIRQNGQSGSTDPGSSTTDPGSSTTDPGSSTTDPGSSTTDPGSSTDPGSGTSNPGSTTETRPVSVTANETVTAPENTVMSNAVSQIKNAEPGEVVVIESNSVSNEVMNTLIANPGVAAQVNLTRNGQTVSVVIVDPIIDSPADYYGPENLIGIYNRSIALQYYKMMFPNIDLDLARQIMIQDAINAREIPGYVPVLPFIAGPDYII